MLAVGILCELSVLCGLQAFEVGRDLFAWHNNPAALTNREDLIRFHLGEALDLLRGGPLHFDCVNDLCFTKTEMQAQVAL